jgi:hypothetical protein
VTDYLRPAQSAGDESLRIRHFVHVDDVNIFAANQESQPEYSEYRPEKERDLAEN